MSRSAVCIFGDQLAPTHPALPASPSAAPCVFMVEALAEASHVWSHKARVAVFLSAMRHHAGHLRAQGYQVVYSTLQDTGQESLVQRLFTLCAQHGIGELHALEPGEWRLEQELVAMARKHDVALRLWPDPHFLCSRAEFAQWAGSKKTLRMEFFYRTLRKRYQVLMNGDEPVGGQWNFDHDNQGAFSKTGPGLIAPPAVFAPDAITQSVFADIEALLPQHPGQLQHFAWPVTRAQAVHALQVFIATRLPHFGQYQDAMWVSMPFGWHALLSCALNLHLLHPLEVVRAAEEAYQQGHVPLASAEGFIRQVLGWREFIRGVYWLDMPAMQHANGLQAERPLPAWFWTGDTPMACLRHVLGQTLEYGYAHHIQRLMVIGNFALLAGLNPQAVSAWFLAVYVDAVEWVELPNVMGMALFANQGRFTSKPYIATGAYIDRMSNYCKGCPYNPKEKLGPSACPFTTLYWRFVGYHQDLMKANPRTALMLKHWEKLDEGELNALEAREKAIRQELSF